MTEFPGHVEVGRQVSEGYDGGGRRTGIKPSPLPMAELGSSPSNDLKSGAPLKGRWPLGD
jgi:hypothetical protein